MLTKSLEFKDKNGQKVKIIDIPVLEKGSSYRFMLRIRLEAFMMKILEENEPKNVYSFKEYLKNVLKWHDYVQLYKTDMLLNNA
ncbi:DUF2535 family protein [Litchfieldia alkalitelluris]|uniref:DUF2535 family protein n=1 Tax=Litchfieldia alkalitelluris TaxID=304268 RepID=UPI000996CFD4|nr:DUF2535 family protein [Litchfieldia alkalitelluris]